MNQALRRALTALVHGRRGGRRTGDRGSGTTEYVLVLVITIGIATAVGAILTPMITESAQSIDLGVNP
ncbi:MULTISPECIES: hypothetical protein [Nocardiopsidaceae]|uniref:Pilus assembly protein n=2 Tax=Nocardiopsidaceae TaxID=83676 RepID=A0ABY6YG43_9ACTN|nr:MULTISPECIES: hypothetical protein [Nocardiopsaceae]MEE2048072.1 hypothetical protein [Nocardiopsis tropica]MEE2050445.1 hypothetical protein [Nocardiopsis umidischolae]WAE71200.1 hypothetical protein OUQ99_18390 [Streptomonospora nanhaiensis]